jgi:hypothetical protein
MRRCLVALCALAVCGVLFGPGAAAAYPASPADTDFDGIPDEWERRGRGPLTPDMVRVGRRDMVMYILRRGGISEADTRTLMARVARFYGELPIDNADGSRGITMTVIYGPEMAREHWGVSFDAAILYNTYIRPEWRGVARTFIIETAPGQGGQTISAEWGATGPPWQAVAHELGHQVMMGHTPPNQPTGGVSPLWPSIMNYM